MDFASPSIAALIASSARSPGYTYTYGTSGFRARAELLDAPCLRMGMMAALRSRCWLVAGKSVAGLDAASGDKIPVAPAVGIVVSASHNPVRIINRFLA